MKKFRSSPLTWLTALAVSGATLGCFNTTAPQAEATKPAESGAVSSEDATPRETLNKTTDVVLALDKAQADGGIVSDMKIEVADPLTQAGAAYRTSVGKLGIMAVQQAIQIRNAQSIQDPKPLTHDQLMKEIIKPGQPDGIRLAMLPYYQEYAWDQKDQKLVVVEFPARKEARQKQLDNN